MNWPKAVGVCLLSLGASGCATEAHRINRAALGPRTGSQAPSPLHAAPRPEQPDIFMAAQATRESPIRLGRYFPGLLRPTPAAAPASGGPVAAPRESAPAEGEIVATTPARPSWFGFRKARGPQTYMTDARGPSPRSHAEPAFLPVALQVPSDRIKDRAVTPTTAEVDGASPGPKPETEPAPAGAEAKPALGNPDASDAAAEPLRADEPRLAVKPFEPAGMTPPAAPIAADPQPAPAEAAQPAPAAEERPAAPQPGENPEPSADPKEPAGPAANPEDSKPGGSLRTPAPNPEEPRGTGADARAAKATPAAADPSNSLGLPPAMLPASYTQHNSVAVRGSYQAPQPPLVLASPQVEASPQSAPAAAAAATKTWQRPCLRRMIRRKFGLGEFANPPTAKPH